MCVSVHYCFALMSLLNLLFVFTMHLVRWVCMYVCVIVIERLKRSPTGSRPSAEASTCLTNSL